MKKIFALLLLLAASQAFAQGFGFTGSPVINSVGQPIAGASVAVTTTNPCGTSPTYVNCNGVAQGKYSGTVPPANLATLYTDITASTTTTNPLTTDAFGNWTAYVGSAANYWIVVYGTRIYSQVSFVSVTSGACSGGGICVITNPATSQTVVQPADGSGNPTSLNDNVFNSLTYAADSFNWSQLPTGALTAGVPAVITLAPCPLGLSILNHSVYLDTVGTPEWVFLTGNTCTSGAASGTVTLTPANDHGAGYKIQSATNGYKEASEFAKLDTTLPTLAQAGYGVVIAPPRDGAVMRGPFYIQASHQRLQLSGGYLRCYVAPCVFVGSATATAFQDITIEGLSCQPQADFTTTVGTTGATCLEDNAQNTRMIAPMVKNPNITYPGAGYSAFYSVVQIDDDEGAVIQDMYISAGSSRFGRCDTTLCSVIINIIGGANFGILELRHANWTLFQSNGIDNQGGNTLNIVDSVCQSQYQFCIRSKGTNLNIAGKSDGWYGESTGFQNPNGTGTAGIIYQGQGWGTLRNSITQGGLPQYTRSNSGATRSTYFVQTVSSTLGSGPWLPAGYCLTNGTGTCNVKWPPIGTAGTISYNVARCLGFPGGGTCPTSLYTDVMVGGSASAVGTVATGITPAGNCTGTATNGSCLLVDDVTASTSAGTGTMFPAYCPAIPFWPGYAVFSNFTDAICNSTPMRLFIDEMQNVSDSPVISGFGAGVPTVIAGHTSTLSGGGGGANAPLWTQALNNGVALGGTVQGALVLQNAPTNNTGGDYTGRFGFINSQTNNSVRGCLYNLHYLNRESILATNGYRVANVAGNNCIGVDVGGTPANTGIGIQVGASLSTYVGIAMDGTSWLERLTAALKTFKVPIQNQAAAAPTGSAGSGWLWYDSTALRTMMKNGANTALQVGNAKDTLSCGTTTTCSNTVLTNPQTIIGTATLAGGTATVTGLTTFTSSTSFKCWASDKTTATNFANAVPASATSVLVSGTGTDVIDWGCQGN